MSAWDEELAKIITTFYLPVNVQTGKYETFRDSEIMRLPFPCMRIVEPWAMPPEARREMEAAGQPGLDRRPGYEHLLGVTFTGVAEYIFQSDDRPDAVGMLSRVTYRVPGMPDRVVYEPPLHDHERAKWTRKMVESAEGEALLVLARFHTYLDARDVRYVEQPATRQVRRSMGVSSDYREYIIIPKERSERYATAHTRAEIIKRLRALHAVRGHLRRYKSGKTVFVRPHSRGTGEALQVKDYVQR